MNATLVHKTRRMRQAQVWFGIVLGASVLLAAAAEASSDEDLWPLVAELLSSSDRDTRGLALQKIREGLPGPAFTRKIADVLPTLAPDGQAALLEALADRGDPSARPAVLAAAHHSAQPVRTSALRALGALGDAAAVPLLADKAGQGSTQEREAARGSLIRLQGEGIDAALMQRLADGVPDVKRHLLPVLSARKMTEAMPLVLRCARDPDPALRRAALAAAQDLARAEDAGALIQLLASSESPECDAAEDALLQVCQREGPDCLERVLGAFPAEQTRTRIGLVRALAAIGGPRALKQITEVYHDDAPAVSDEALRILSAWPDQAAAPHLLRIGERTENAVHQVLAVRGIVRLARSPDSRPANGRWLLAAWRLSAATDEKRLVLGALPGCPTPESLRLALQALEEPGLVDEAALAAVSIIENQLPKASNEARSALRRVLERAQNPAIRERATQALRGLAEETP